MAFENRSIAATGTLMFSTVAMGFRYYQINHEPLELDIKQVSVETDLGG